MTITFLIFEDFLPNKILAVINIGKFKKGGNGITKEAPTVVIR